MLKLQTKTKTYDVVKNTDGTLSISHNGEPIQNAGSFIVNMGGIVALLSKCKEYTEKEWQAELSRQEAEKANKKAAGLARQEEAKKQHEEDYKALFGSGEVIEATPHSIYVLLAYLNDQNWGSWSLPKMSIGYTCNQYDCGGIQATTIRLDRPIKYYDEMVSQFKVGGTPRHLIDYKSLRGCPIGDTGLTII